jgi:hypothetical protein
VVIAVVVVAVAGLVTVVVPQEASAGELEAFGSCDELAAWEPAEGLGLAGGRTAGDVEDAARGEAVPAADSAAGAGTGQTNVAVRGVDELDVVDRVDDRRVLVAAGGALALVDLSARTRLASIPVADDARLTFDPDAGVVWVAGHAGGGGVEVTRVVLAGDELVPDGSWTASGRLVDARRTGDRLHVVAVDGFPSPEEGRSGIPFAGGPVPCEAVLRPTAPSGPEATLVATLPATGDVEPLQAAELVGSGQLVHVTRSAAYLATPLWEDGVPATSIHRFDLATLSHTGSGRIEGSLLDQFSMSEHEGFLRVAVTHGGGVSILPVPGAVDLPLAEPAGPGRAPAGAASPLPGDEPVEPVPVEPVPEPVPLPRPVPREPLNEILVLDTVDSLDVVGRTPRFGHAGETLHGARFDGATAYAVTFLTTDPFYVVDVSDPAAPRVVGEVELPGFSSYLHPVGEGLVAGFGPGGDGRAAVKLFDVADPARPTVVDDETLGDTAPVVWDHHAFVDLGSGRFTVPASTWRQVEPAGCTPPVRERLAAEARAAEDALFRAYDDTRSDDAISDDARVREVERRVEELWSDPCLFPPSVVDTTVVVADTARRVIDVVERITLTTPEPGTRVLPTDGRWAVLAGAHLVWVDPDGTPVADLSLS